MNAIKKILSLLFSPLAIGLYITFAMTFVAFNYYVALSSQSLAAGSFYEQLRIFHERTIDLRLIARGQKDHFNSKAEKKVAILTIDEKAVKEIGHWPWPREVMAKVIDRLMSYNPRVLAFDIVWPEPDPKSAIPTLVELRNFARKKGASNEVIEKKINQQLARLNSDEIFARTILKHSDKLIMGSYYEEEQKSGYYNIPHQDLCFTNLFQKTYEYSYFEKEEPLLLVLDAAETFLPEAWSEVLDSHLATIELKTIDDRAKNGGQNITQKVSSIRSLLERYGVKLNDQGLIVVLQFFINGRAAELRPQFEKLNPLLSSAPENIDRLIADITRLFDVNMRGKFRDEIELRKQEYCSRFLTDKDEALEKYKARWEDVQSEDESFQNLSFADGIRKFKDSSLKNYIPQTFKWSVNIPVLGEGTKHSAFFNASQDADGSIRRGQLVKRSGNMYIPSLPLAAFLRGSNYVASLNIETGSYDNDKFKYPASLEVVDPESDSEDPVMRVPIDSHGQLPINYAGADRMYPYLSVADLMSDSTKALVEKRVFRDGKWVILDQEVDKVEFINNTYFLMGATATGIYDLRVTPFSENYPGVETHANILDNLVRKDFLTRNAAAEESMMPLAILVLGVLLSVIIAKLGALSGALASILSLVGILYYDSIYMFGTGTVVAIIFPIVLVIALYIFLTGYKYFTEESQKRELKGTFQKYVSPSIVNEVLKDPTNLQLGGRKQIMSVFFSDVRGFTTISEKLDPNALSDLLNSYLTPMTEIVFKNKGTLDKYMGDAVMAFFGAPIPYEDHALMACRCALEQLEELRKLQMMYEKKGMPSIDIGIGINTGEMSVGNMGSETVRNYTVMGDAVNLGSRLEGINKQYGTRIIISEFTYNDVKDKVVAREIDWVRVKGKALPVRIYELVSEKEPQADTMSMLEQFGKGFIEYHNRSFDKAVNLFTNALNHKPDDPVSKLYIQRCQSYIETPPPDDWDGVFIMTSK